MSDFIIPLSVTFPVNNIDKKEKNCEKWDEEDNLA